MDGTGSTMHPQRREGGQAVIMFVIFITVALLFVAVVIDGGMYFVEKRDMQGTADAAAMAAVRELPTSVTRANDRAQEYVATHNASAEGTLESIEFADGNTTVRVTVGKTGTQSFGSLMGRSAPAIGARATARVQMMGPRPGMLPMAFMRDQYTIGANEEVKWDDPGAGNRGAIAPNVPPDCSKASGSDDFRELIQGDEAGGMDACASDIASTIDTEPGQMAGPSRDGFNTRLSANAQEFDDVFGIDPVTGLHTVEDPNSPRIGIVPIIENVDGTNLWPGGRSNPVRILGYMLVYIGNTDVAGNPAYTNNGKSIWVTPVRPILPDELAGDQFIEYDATLDAPVVYRLTE